MQGDVVAASQSNAETSRTHRASHPGSPLARWERDARRFRGKSNGAVHLMARVLIAGCGYVGTALGLRLVEHGHAVWALRRDPAGLPGAFYKLAGDLANPDDLRVIPSGLDHVVYTASAGEPSDAAYERAYVTGLSNLLTAIATSSVRRVFFTSSTAVYAQTDGAWVDEDSDTAPAHFSGRRTLQAEALLRAAQMPSTVLRCAGIYGPGRTRLIDAVRQGTASMSVRYTNRIHRDDIAGAILHLMAADEAPATLLLSDDEPAPQRDVTAFIAERLGVPLPAGSAPAEAPARGGDKRCNNARLRATGYALLYPTYREGYAAMLARPAPRV
jgi:nucleoside-diphosphate-sugar epimerase